MKSSIIKYSAKFSSLSHEGIGEVMNQSLCNWINTTQLSSNFNEVYVFVSSTSARARWLYKSIYLLAENYCFEWIMQKGWNTRACFWSFLRTGLLRTNVIDSFLNWFVSLTSKLPEVIQGKETRYVKYQKNIYDDSLNATN